MGKKRIKTEKGISPLIATILLIGFVVVLALILFLWGGRFVEEKIETTELKVKESFACIVSFDVSFSCDGSITIENKDKRIEKMIVKVYYGDSIVKRDDMFDSIPSFGIEKSKYTLDLFIVEKIDFIPVIKEDNKELACSSSIMAKPISCVIGAGGSTPLTFLPGICGNKLLDLSSEECDDGNTDDGDGCDSNCVKEYCGDNVLQMGLGEECDDGANGDDTDLCFDDCTFTFCGDDVIQNPNGIGLGGPLNDGDEDCDDGESNSDIMSNACRTDCRNAYCGDGVVDNGEGCDDGNNIDNDECSNSCELQSCAWENSIVVSDEISRDTPRIYEDKIVWEENWDISYGDTKITGSSDYQWSPAIYENKIVWVGETSGWDSLFMCDLSVTDPGIDGYCYDDSKHVRITSVASISDPDIYGDKIVWKDNRNGPPNIYMCDLSITDSAQSGYCYDDSKHVRITNVNSASPDIYGTKIVWIDGRNYPLGVFSDIYMCDLSITDSAQSGYCYDDSKHVRITMTGSNILPSIYENKIVWSSTRNLLSLLSNIYLYDVAIGEEDQITDITTKYKTQSFPVIYGDKIVWQGMREGITNWNIYVYDLSTESEIRITTDSDWDYTAPDIYEDKIVWVGDNRILYLSSYECS